MQCILSICLDLLVINFKSSVVLFHWSILFGVLWFLKLSFYFLRRSFLVLSCCFCWQLILVVAYLYVCVCACIWYVMSIYLWLYFFILSVERFKVVVNEVKYLIPWEQRLWWSVISSHYFIDFDSSDHCFSFQEISLFSVIRYDVSFELSLSVPYLSLFHWFFISLEFYVLVTIRVLLEHLFHECCMSTKYVQHNLKCSCSASLLYLRRKLIHELSILQVFFQCLYFVSDCTKSLFRDLLGKILKLLQPSL